MCGRFAVSITKSDIEKLLPKAEPKSVAPNYNVAPTQNVPVIKDSNPNEISYLKWGLIPVWAKDRTIASKLINARSETANEKPSFRSAFKKRRCLFLATGYYEWKKVGKEKFPYYIGFDNKPFLMAGLWERWTDKSNGEIIETSTILTCDPNEFTKDVHHRMPVILKDKEVENWLDPESNQEKLQSFMKPCDPDGMTAWEVSKEVNSPRNNYPKLIERV